VGAVKLGDLFEALELSGKSADIESCKSLMAELLPAFATVAQKIKQSL
jgi:hypothetical protein